MGRPDVPNSWSPAQVYPTMCIPDLIHPWHRLPALPLPSSRLQIPSPSTGFFPFGEKTVPPSCGKKKTHQGPPGALLPFPFAIQLGF